MMARARGAELALITLIVAASVGFILLSWALAFTKAQEQDPPAASWPVICRVVQPEDLEPR